MARTPPKQEEQEETSHASDAPVWSRRRWLGSSVALPFVGAAAAASLKGEMPYQTGQAAIPAVFTENPNTAASSSYVYFTPAEAAFIEAAVARLIPKDELGAGALEAGVSFFIDRQLAGDYGAGSRWYMQGPWDKGESTQGFQSRMPPAAYYRAAIREIGEAVSREANGGTFAKLAPADMDAWLHRLEDGKVELATTDAKAFFKMLWQNTLEGFWSDPVYGGNRDLVGWKLIGFPGARYDHSPYVGKHGEAYPLPPVGLKGRVEWIAKG